MQTVPRLPSGCAGEAWYLPAILGLSVHVSHLFVPDQGCTAVPRRTSSDLKSIVSWPPIPETTASRSNVCCNQAAAICCTPEGLCSVVYLMRTRRTSQNKRDRPPLFSSPPLPLLFATTKRPRGAIVLRPPWPPTRLMGSASAIQFKCPAYVTQDRHIKGEWTM